MRFKDELQRWIYYQSQVDCCHFIIGEYSEKLKGKEPINVIGLLQGITETLKVMIRCMNKIDLDSTPFKELLKRLSKDLKRHQKPNEK